jgi:hypothetical protein
MEGANGCSSAIPIQIAAVAVQVAMFIPQSSSLLPCPRIIAEVDIAPYFAVVAGNPYLIPPDIVPIPPIAIARKHRSRTHTDHQQDSGNHTFHILSLRSAMLFAFRGNHIYWMQTRPWGSSCAETS